MTAQVEAALQRLRASLPSASDKTLDNLLYLAFGVHLAETLEPLFLNDLLPTADGAKVGPPRTNADYEPASTLSESEERVIDRVALLYGRLREDELIAAVKATDSWDEAFHGGWIICPEVIRDEFIRLGHQR